MKTPRGEIDLIARPGKKVAFVETKSTDEADGLQYCRTSPQVPARVAAAEILMPK